MKNLFQAADSQEIIDRINNLTPNSTPLWGKMNVGQVLAHLCVTYEMTYTDLHKAPNFFLKFILKTFVKNAVVGPKDYPKNSRTAPAFIITDTRDFEKEKARLIDYINQTQKHGADFFDGKENLSFGKLSWQEWNMLFYKHLNHHLTQFGV